jgi:hypothetical protein
MAESKICWLKKGNLGVRLVSLSPEHKSGLQDWLARKLEEALPESVVRQFQKVETSFIAPVAETNQDTSMAGPRHWSRREQFKKLMHPHS